MYNWSSYPTILTHYTIKDQHDKPVIIITPKSSHASIGKIYQFQKCIDYYNLAVCDQSWACETIVCIVDTSQLYRLSTFHDKEPSSHDYDDNVESVTIGTQSCHLQSVGHHGDYIDYMKQAEERSHEPSLPVVKTQPIRIEGFGSNDLNIQCNKDDKVSRLYHIMCYSYIIAILP